MSEDTWLFYVTDIQCKLRTDNGIYRMKEGNFTVVIKYQLSVAIIATKETFSRTTF